MYFGTSSCVQGLHNLKIEYCIGKGDDQQNIGISLHSIPLFCCCFVSVMFV